MPISYTFSDGGVYFQFNGHFDFKEAPPMIADIFKDKRFTPGVNFLVDVRQTARSRTMEEAFEFFDLIKSRCEFKGSKIAIVASRPVSFGLARMISVYLEDFDISMDVFKNLEDAEKWLET